MHEIRAVQAAAAAACAQRATAGRRIANKTETRAASVSVLFSAAREIKRRTRKQKLCRPSRRDDT